MKRTRNRRMRRNKTWRNRRDRKKGGQAKLSLNGAPAVIQNGEYVSMNGTQTKHSYSPNTNVESIKKEKIPKHHLPP